MASRSSRWTCALAALALATGCARADVPAGRAPAAARELPAVAQHVPEGCHAVVHVDFRGPGGSSRMRSLLAAAPGLAEHARVLGAVHVEQDIHGAVACFRAGTDGVSTALVAAGSIPGDAVVPALAGSGDDVTVVPLAGREVAAFFVEGRRWFAGQASDGSIVLGDDAQLVGSALLTSDRGRSLSLPWDAPLAIVAEGAALARAAKQGGADHQVAGALLDASSMTVVAAGKLTLRLSYPDARRAEEVRGPLRDALDARAGLGARVDARVEGNDAVIDVEPSPSTDGARDAFSDLAIVAAVGSGREGAVAR